MPWADSRIRVIERASLVGALLMAIASLTVYIAVLKSYDEPNTFNPLVVTFVAVMVVGIFGIVALLLGANRAIAIPIMSLFGLVGALGMASVGFLFVVVAGLLVPSLDARRANTTPEQR